MTPCAFHPCTNTIAPTGAGGTPKRYCSRQCQVDAYRRQHTRRTYVTLTRDEHQAVRDFARSERTTVDDIIAIFVREGLAS